MCLIDQIINRAIREISRYVTQRPCMRYRNCDKIVGKNATIIRERIICEIGNDRGCLIDLRQATVGYIKATAWMSSHLSV